jgi:adenine-specific DNA-methyltransferase
MEKFVKINKISKLPIEVGELKKSFADNLGEVLKEKYGLSWAGKVNAKKEALTPTSKTLNPQEKESKNWDDTENVFIEGDNLEALKLLQRKYFEKIKMIYIDPPYNTGKDFIYKDNFARSTKEELEASGEMEEGALLTTNAKTNGRFHSDWLNMMYSRLFLAHKLLKDDGVIFISIDDNEVANLRLLMDEIFGEENFVANIIWKRKRGRDNSAKWFSRSHEFLLVYAKNIENFSINLLELNEETKKAYKNQDNDERGSYRMLACWARGTQGGVKYEFTTRDGQKFKERLWLMSKKNLHKLDAEDKLIIRGDNIYRKLFLSDNKGKIPETIWDHTSNAANASDEIKSIFKDIIFDTPKPIPYVQEILKITTNKDNDIILDFFAGSGTTAHAEIDFIV